MINVRRFRIAVEVSQEEGRDGGDEGSTSGALYLRASGKYAFLQKNIFAYPGTFTILRMYLFFVLILCNIISEQYPSSSLRLPLHLVV